METVTKVGHMKNIILIFLLTFFGQTFASEKKYTQDEFDKKLKEELEIVVEKLKKKSLTQLANDLLNKELKLKRMEAELAHQKEQLEMSEKTFATKILAFEKEKKDFIGCIDKHNENEQMRVTQLVSVISNMKPQKAADLLSVQEADISVKLLEKIAPEKASKIFNLMDKEVSARLQKQYLNMRQ